MPPIAAPGTLRPGDLVDRFRVVKRLGAGGMGEVWLALDKKDNRNVALKVMKAGTPGSERNLPWFLREVALYRKMTHPNVVNFIAAGEVQGMHWVALEHIIGMSLRQWLNRNGPVPLRQAFSWTQDLVFALHAAHQQGIVHRDLKPENIMITTDQKVKMIDFGLARVDREPSADERDEREVLFQRGRPRDGKLSGDSGIVGTLSYLPPEALLGKPADERSDVYSLGLVFYEMLTGGLLIRDVSSAAAIMGRHREVDRMASFLPRPLEPLGEALERFVLRMLRADPAERFATTVEAVQALQKLAAQFADELRGDAGTASAKRLAQQELVDTHFWQAMNLFAEAKVALAVEELFRIFSFVSSLEPGSRESVLRELDLLFLTLRARSGPGDDGDPYALERPALVELLRKVLRLYRAMAEPAAAAVKMRLFLRRLRGFRDEPLFDASVQAMLQEHIGDALLTRAFVESLGRSNPLIAKDVWLKFTRELLLKGRLREARQELEACGRRFGADLALEDCLRDLADLERSVEEEEEQALELLENLRESRAFEQSLTLCLSFLGKCPESLRILEALARLYGAEGRTRPLGALWTRIGVLRFWRGEPDEARAAFVRALEVDERDATAINYLVELLDDEGLLGPVTHDYRALVFRLYEALNLYAPARRELERQLSGTVRDAEIYERLRALAERAGRGDDVWRTDFKLGELHLQAGQAEAAKKAFERGLSSSSSPRAAADELRRVPGIHKVYSLAELAARGRAAGDGRADSDRRTIEALRSRARDREVR